MNAPPILPIKPQSNKTFKIACGSFMLLFVGCAGFLVYFVRGCMSEHSRPIGHSNITFDVSPDGRTLVFTGEGNGGRDLFLFDLATKQVTSLTDSEDYEILPCFAPDGKKIAFTRGKPGIRADQLCVMDLASKSISQLTNADENISSPTFNSDGTRIIFTLETEYRWGGLASSWEEGGRLYSISVDGKDKRTFRPDLGEVFNPRISPDGKWITFGSMVVVSQSPRQKTDLAGFVVSLQAPDQKAELTRYAREMSFSKDSKFVAYSAGQYAPDGKIFVSPVGSKSSSSIGRGDGGSSDPRFSPDGKTIYFLVEKWPQGLVGEPVRSLWSASAKGGNIKQIADSSLFSQPRSYRP